ncbi:diguanylate cyclase [Arcobacter sp. FWKO B]|uniref:GGDEF domain-containing response regulator n=1 Tax=Arcobacter sp. FWKO B TaxID=2593672 RepID=UPI0018A65F18|nr:diguanylate cyclase [Arcobacter sp. FWKO B]QOG12738.1 diguanylate cyclase [Arcobacter sp. FWKO B]
MAKILIVEDSQTILARLSDAIIKTLKYDVIQASSFEDAKNRLNKYKDIDMALLDLGLPDAKDEEIVDFVQKFNIPIVVLTGSDNDKTKELISKKDILAYIIKDRSYAVEYAINIVKRFIKNKKTHILIVDDSKTFGAQLANLCQKYNLLVSIATSGKEALEILSKNIDIKLVFVDFIMPNMNGLELTTEIRKTHSKDDLAIIALSGNNEKEVVTQFLKYGANDFISKDFANEELIARLNNSLEILELFETSRDLANKDFLTDLFNRRYFFNTCNILYEKAKKEKQNICVALIDIDNFKVINDTHGHEVGDFVLKHLSKLLKTKLNDNIMVSRFGGEEFCLFFDNFSEIDSLKELEQLRIAVNNGFVTVNEDTKIKYTFSCGISSNVGDSLDSMINYADISLYQAKTNGKNQIQIYKEDKKC